MLLGVVSLYMRKLFQIFPVGLLVLSLVACGDAVTSSPPLPGTPGIPPSNTPPDDSGDTPESKDLEDKDGTYNLAEFAKITASSVLPDQEYDWAADYIADGLKGKDERRGHVWIPEKPINGASITLEWNSQVEVSEIHLYDSPKKGHQILKGEIRFMNEKDSNISFTPMTFGQLDDEANEALKISGPGKPFTQMTIHILDHKGNQTGLAEVAVLGKRVDEAIPEDKGKSLTQFCHVSDYSSVHKPIQKGSDNGFFRTHSVKDNDPKTAWLSDNNGSNAFVELECDREYEITQVLLTDARAASPFYPIFIEANVHFMDINKKFSMTKAASDIAPKEVPLPSDETIKSKKIRIEIADYKNLSFSDLPDLLDVLDSFGLPGELKDELKNGINLNRNNDDTGFAEIKIFGSYTPVQKTESGN